MQETQKNWTQSWWGILVLIALVLLLMFVFGFLYQYLDVVRQGRDRFIQQSISSFTSLQQGDSLAPAVPSIQATIETDDDPFKGNTNAPIVIVEFSDFQCPFCRRAYPILSRLVATYPDDVKLIYRDFPIQQIHSQALDAAMAAECADDQGKFWLYHDLVFENQNQTTIPRLKELAAQVGMDSTAFNSCLDSQKYRNEVLDDFQEGIALGVSGTPTFFINGSKIAGVVPFETLEQLVLAARARQ